MSFLLRNTYKKGVIAVKIAANIVLMDLTKRREE
jgi:hypothetical protein